MTDERDPFSPPPEIEPTFYEVDVETTRRARLAERDPHAPEDESAEYPITGAISFDDVLRRARWQGFLAGAAAGGVAGAVLAAVVTLAVSRAAAPAVAPVVVAEIPQAAPATAEPWPTSPVPRRSVRAGTSSASPPAPAPAAAPAPSALERALRRAVVEPASLEERHAASPATAEGTVAASGASTEKTLTASDGAASEAPPPAAVAEPPRARPPKATEVVAALGRQREALDACVADMPGDDEAARGRRFRILVVVEPSGQVSEARAYDDAIAATRLGTCLVKLAQGLAFAPFEGEAVRLEVPIRADDAP